MLHNDQGKQKKKKIERDNRNQSIITYGLIDFNRLRHIDGFQDLEQDSRSLIRFGEQGTGQTE
jgi:hypothetical protein